MAKNKAKKNSYNYPSFDAGGRVDKYHYGGEVNPSGPLSPPILGQQDTGAGQVSSTNPLAQGPVVGAPVRRYKKGGKVNKEAVKELKEKYFTDDSGITHLGKPKKGETAWEAHIRHSGGKSKYFKNEKEYKKFRESIKK